MSVDGIIAITTTVVVFLTLQLRRRTPTEIVFLGGLIVVILSGVISPTLAFSGFSSSAVLTIGGLLVCGAALRETGVLDWFGERLLGSAEDERTAMLRLFVTLLIASAFLLNTVVVVMMMPVVLDWCRKRRIAPSRLLIPVSYFAILGGVCTLIGTSTTLVMNSELQSQQARHEAKFESRPDLPVDDRDRAEAFALQLHPIRMFEIGQAGFPCAVVGGLVLLFLGPHLLPNRTDMLEQFGEQRREYLVEMQLQGDSAMVGQSVGQAGLRRLPGLFLIEINRQNEVITPVSPSDVLRPNDRLIFSGVVSTIVDLEKIPGLIPTADDSYVSDPKFRQRRNLTEVVLSRTCPLIGSSVRDGAFRQHYNAAVVAVHRNGVRLTNKIGNIVLEPGDTLLLQTSNDFVPLYRNHRDFFLVSTVAGATPRRSDRAPLAAMLGLVLVGWLAMTSLLSSYPWMAGLSSTAVAAIAIAGLTVVTKCISVSDARQAINLPLLLTIAGALGLAKALDESQADEFIANGIIAIVGQDPWPLLITVYGLTMIFTEMITNNAVAVTLLPIAVRVAEGAGYSPRPFIMAIALAASLSFLTPIGYQTNLMVMGPGGYHTTDYFKVGLPVAVAVAITALALIPNIWPFAM
jgi:di/tricarboxylate transporter